MERLRRMTILIKYPVSSLKRNKEWIKRMEEKSIDWAQWGGWFDSDGSFGKAYNKQKKYMEFKVELKLKDRDPVELFSTIFETSLRYNEYNTKTPNGNKYVAKVFRAQLTSRRALWFANKIKKYILQKTEDLQRLLNESNITYKPYLENWNKEEWTSYITTLMEGDGSYNDKTKSHQCFFSLNSSNIFFLQYIVKELKKHNVLNFSNPCFSKEHTRNDGTKSNHYILYSIGKMKEIKKVLESLLPYMTMERKKQNVLNTLTWIDARL
jgi:hypothetical protein